MWSEKRSRLIGCSLTSLSSTATVASHHCLSMAGIQTNNPLNYKPYLFSPGSWLYKKVRKSSNMADTRQYRVSTSGRRGVVLIKNIVRSSRSRSRSEQPWTAHILQRIFYSSKSWNELNVYIFRCKNKEETEIFYLLKDSGGGGQRGADIFQTKTAFKIIHRCNNILSTSRLRWNVKARPLKGTAEESLTTHESWGKKTAEKKSFLVFN